MKALILAALAIFGVFSSCDAEQPSASRDRIAIGMRFDEALQLLKRHHCKEVAKDVEPPTRCFVVAEHRVLYIQQARSVVTELTIEDGADRPKAFRTHRRTQAYDLP